MQQAGLGTRMGKEEISVLTDLRFENHVWKYQQSETTHSRWVVPGRVAAVFLKFLILFTYLRNSQELIFQ